MPMVGESDYLSRLLFNSTVVTSSIQLPIHQVTVPNMSRVKSLFISLLLSGTHVLSGAAQSSSVAPTPVTTTALPGTVTPRDHWRPNRPDKYVCEYLGGNGCWQPKIVQEGPPCSGFEQTRSPRTKKCVVQAGNDPSKDDAPAIREAFAECHEDGHVIFDNTTYYVHIVLNTTGLRNVDVEVLGTLSWNNSGINYWLNNSLYVCHIRPDDCATDTDSWQADWLPESVIGVVLWWRPMHFYGHGVGTLHGNGQVW